MFRDLLINQPNIVHLSVYRDIKDVVQDLYKSELISFSEKDFDKEQTNSSQNNSSLLSMSAYSRNNLAVLANAAAIELYLLCVEDEQGNCFF